MYFEITPKARREDLFGMDYLVDSLESYLTDENVRMIIIKGLRRTGKTSLLNVILNEIKQKKVKIDVREAPFYDKKEFLFYVFEKIKEAIGETLLQKILKHIRSIELSYNKIGTTFYLKDERTLYTFFEKLDRELKKKNIELILAFDEAQLLNKIKFNYILANIYDNYTNIKIILTGSEIGLLDTFLGKKDAKSPLFGRAVIEIETKRLNNEQIAQFLTQGFSEIRKKITINEIKEVIENFDGIIGWATYYGWLRSKNIPHTQAILNVSEEGEKLVKDELDKFLANRRRTNYLRVLRWIGSGNNRWSILKNKFSKIGVKISDRQLNLYLKELVNYSFVEKLEENYFITDPLLVRVVSHS